MGNTLGPDDWRRAAGSDEFAAYLRRARERFLRREAMTLDELRRVYRRAARSVRRDVETAAPGSLRRAHLERLAQLLDQRARELTTEVLDAIHAGIRFSAIEAVSGPTQLALALLGGVFEPVQVRALFADVNERAVAALLARTGPDGLKLSDRVWRAGETWRRAARTVIEDAVARGQDARRTARQLDQYLQPGVFKALKAETRRRLGVPKDVSHQAMRLAVTEMNNAFQEGTVTAGQAMPSYRGIIWRLSKAHAVPDRCDELATHNGNGFWPKGEEPTRPHPWCRCVALPAHENADAFTERLVTWVRDPGSQPDLEQWYQEIGQPFLRRPAPILRGAGVGAGSGGVPILPAGIGGGGGASGGSGGGIVPPSGVGGGGATGGGMPPGQHPTDDLIRQLIQTRRVPTSAEITQILSHVATAVFGSRPVNVPRRDRGLSYQGITLGAQASPLEYHLVKRVAAPNEQQWAIGTTAAEYLDDLRRATQAPSVRLALYVRDRQHIAAIIALTEDVVPLVRRGTNWHPNLLVVYSADRGRIVTGYQFSRIEALDIPGDVQWFERP